MPHSLQTEPVFPQDVTNAIRQFATDRGLVVRSQHTGSKAHPFIVLQVIFSRPYDLEPLVSFIQSFSWFAEHNEDGIKELYREPYMTLEEGRDICCTYRVAYIFYLPPAPECPLWTDLED